MSHYPAAPRSLLLPLVILPLLASCSSDESAPVPQEAAQTLLVYAVASNNLYPNFHADTTEMQAAARHIDIDRFPIMLYCVTPDGDPELKRMVKRPDGSCCFVTVRTYDRSIFSTDPRRMKAVIADMEVAAPAEKYGLVCWSHATGWSPNFSGHQVPGMDKSFGQDKYNGTSDYLDIDELADAVPDRMFEYIWFDCCYMGAVEVAYQLKDKCRYLIAYPTEIMNAGNCYNTTLQYVLRDVPDYVEAARTLFKSYDDFSVPVSVGVFDLSEFEALADATRAIYAAGEAPEASALQNYGRRPNGPYYDFGQYTLSYTADEALRSRFTEALDAMTLYKAVSSKDFNGFPFDTEVYSGLSCHYLDPEVISPAEDYYRTLDWYKRVY